MTSDALAARIAELDRLVDRDMRASTIAMAGMVDAIPPIDDRTGSSREGPQHAGTMFWPAESNVYGWRAFLGVAPGGPTVPSAAVPARTSDLSGLAPSFIGVGAIELFAEESIECAQRLIASGVPTELHVVPGAVHGFDEISPGTAPVKQFHALKREALRRAFGKQAADSLA